MPKPFANSQPITPSLISGDWLLGIQTGNSTGDNGLPQMKYIKLSQLTDWVRSNFGEMWRYRGEFSASLPSDPQDGDYFLATATFTVGDDTYTEDHLYAYNGSSWDDISNVLTQYASQSQVTDIDDRLGVLEVKVDAMGDGVVYKGEVATSADLAGIVDPQTGWEYFVTADASFYIYNGSSWDQIDNGIVQTITDGDISHAPSGDAVYDALQSEATARANADSNLLAAIQANSNRISNLEEKAGDYVEVNYRGTNAVPTGKAKYALANTIVGKTRAWNQLVDVSKLASSSGAVNGITLVKNNDGSYTLSGTASAEANFVSSAYLPITSGHSYLIGGATAKVHVGITSVGGTEGASSVIKTPSSSYATRSFYLSVPNGTDLTTPVTIYPFIRDLTPIFPEGVPATVAECVQKCPDILKYDAYGYSLVDTEVEGVESVGVNIWDEEWEVGSITSAGADATASTSIRSKNYIPVPQLTDLYVYVGGNVPSSQMVIHFYDENKTHIIYSGTGAYENGYNGASNTFTPPNGTVYIRFRSTAQYGSTYKHDVQFCLNSYTDKTTYHPYMKETLSLSSPVTLRSAGDVADTDELNVEVSQGVYKRRQTTRVGYVADMGTDLDWTYSSTTEGYYTTLNNPRRANAINTLISNGFTQSPNYNTYASSASDKCYFKTSNSDELYIKDKNNGLPSSFLAGVSFAYELAEPTVTLLDPIINNTIATEGGGTINTIQTQTPVIDNCLDVGYLAL